MRLHPRYSFTRSTALALGVAGMLACNSDQPPTAPDAADLDAQGSTITTVRIAPRIDGSVRNGNTVLENSVVQVLHDPSMEDRGIVEFGLQSFSAPVLKATLRLTVYASKGPYPFRVDVYGYRGDGNLQIDDWDRGTFISSFEYAGESSVAVDVTAKVQAMKSGGAKVAGFNLRTVRHEIPLNGPFVAFHSNEYPPRAVLNIKTVGP